MNLFKGLEKFGLKTEGTENLFEEEKRTSASTENAVSKRSHPLFDYGSSGCISCLADYYVCLKKSKCNWQFQYRYGGEDLSSAGSR